MRRFVLSTEAVDVERPLEAPPEIGKKTRRPLFLFGFFAAPQHIHHCDSDARARPSRHKPKPVNKVVHRAGACKPKKSVMATICAAMAFFLMKNAPYVT
jgi:hypothetical protein